MAPRPEAPPAYAPLGQAYAPFGAPPSVSPSTSNTPWLAVSEPRRSRRSLVVIIILAVALAGAIAAFAFYFIKLDEANARIEEQNQKIEDQQNLIEQKETFGAAMVALLDAADKFDGTPLKSVIPFDSYELFAAQGWVHRWDPDAMARDVVKVEAATKDLEDLFATATTQAGTNGTSSTFEAVIDQLGGGLVTSLLEDADTVCQGDVLACVIKDDPLTVHFDAGDDAMSWMTDEIRTGIAYHEFAHVLQLTNPEPTLKALESFSGDKEIMADCYALTYLDGWTLEHRIRVNGSLHWVTIGYGYTCNEAERQVIRDWVGQLGFHIQPISQDRARV